MGRQAANTKLSSHVAVRSVRVRGGNHKFRALRLDHGNFSWGTEVRQQQQQPFAAREPRVIAAAGSKQILLMAKWQSNSPWQAVLCGSDSAATVIRHLVCTAAAVPQQWCYSSGTSTINRLCKLGGNCIRWFMSAAGQVPRRHASWTLQPSRRRS